MHVFLANILERLGSMIAGIFNILFARLIRKTTSLRNDDTNYDCITCMNLFLLVGTVVYRFDRQRICTVSNICCSLCNIGILISLYYGMIILVFIFLFLENACIQFSLH